MPLSAPFIPLPLSFQDRIVLTMEDQNFGGGVDHEYQRRDEELDWFLFVIY